MFFNEKCTGKFMHCAEHGKLNVNE